METQSQLKGAPVHARECLFTPVKRSAKSGVAPSVPGSAEAGRRPERPRKPWRMRLRASGTNDVANSNAQNVSTRILDLGQFDLGQSVFIRLRPMPDLGQFELGQFNDPQSPWR